MSLILDSLLLNITVP